MAIRCTTRLTDAIAAQVKQGVPPHTAASRNGLWPATYDEWMAKGERNKRGEWPYAKFRKAILTAEADFEAELLARIHPGADGEHWRAAAWLAERRFPDRYLRRSITSIDDGERPDIPAEPTADRLDQLAARRQRRRSQLTDGNEKKKTRARPEPQTK